jgi:hypothetical protein
MTTKQQTDILRARSPQQWRLLINQVPKDIRAYVARLVWWDWFSHRPVTDAWTHLNDLIHIPYSMLMWERENPDKVKEPNPKEIKSVLQALGYPKALAENRI